MINALRLRSGTELIDNRQLTMKNNYEWCARKDCRRDVALLRLSKLHCNVFEYRRTPVKGSCRDRSWPVFGQQTMKMFLAKKKGIKN